MLFENTCVNWWERDFTASCRPTAPKIPDGEKVDFDVSTRRFTDKPGHKELNDAAVPPPTGHPEETSEQGSDRAAGPDRCSLRVQEEGGGGADCPKGQDCEWITPTYKSKGSLNLCLRVTWIWWLFSQEKRRAERAEQQRVRAEKDKERQARREVRLFCKSSSILELKEHFEFCLDFFLTSDVIWTGALTPTVI